MKYLPFATAACALVLAVGCGSTSTPGSILKVGNGAEPKSLDPHLVTGIPEHHILGTLFEGLVRLDPKDLSIIPGVAETWEVSDDGKVYTFHLRDDAKWSNGDALTAKDFAYAWRRILEPNLASKYAYMLYPMTNSKAYNEGTLTDFSQVGVNVVDDRTLTVTLDNPTPYFLTLHQHYSWFPVHQATIEEHGKIDDRISKWTRAENFVGNGPYSLSAWRPNAVIEVRPNPHYWDAEGMLNDGVNFYPISSDQTEERKFRKGELDITENVPLSKVARYRERNPDLFRADPWIGSYFYRVNVTRPPCDDVRVRQALALAIDRDAICSQVVQAGETPAPYLTPPNINGYAPETGIGYDVARAKKLLADAGYPNGEGFPGVDILYNTLEKHKIIAVTIQQMWKENLNIKVTLTNQDWKVYLASTSNEQLNYDIARAGWIGDVVDPINFLECFISGGGNNRTGWGNDEYDRFLEMTKTAESNEDRNNLYAQAEAILVEEVPVIPIFHYTRPFLIQANVRGLHSNILGYYAYHKVYFAKDES